MTKSPGGDDKLLERTAEGTRWSLPADQALVPGHRDRWSVEADGRTVVAEFAVATTGQRQKLAVLKPADSAPIADWAIYVIVMKEAGAPGEARRAWGRIAALRPESDTARGLSR